MVGTMALAGALASEARAGGGRLEETRSSVRPPSPAPPPTARPPVRPPNEVSNIDYSRVTTSPSGTRIYTRPAPDLGSGATRVTTYTVVRRRPAPQAVPPPQAMRSSERLDLEAPPPRPAFQRFVGRFPYESRRSGWVIDPWEGNPKEHRTVSGRIAAEGSYQYRGLWRTGVSARVGSPRVDVDTQLSFYIEPAERDGMYLGETMLNFAPVALPGIVWRVGVGTRYMADARLPGSGPREFAAGWNVGTSLDVFPGNPFVISARVDRGTLYRTPVWRARATIGVVRRHIELFVGYDHTQVERVSLGGPLLGLRAWL